MVPTSLYIIQQRVFSGKLKLKIKLIQLEIEKYLVLIIPRQFLNACYIVPANDTRKRKVL